jgi:hypothetical protein
VNFRQCECLGGELRPGRVLTGREFEHLQGRAVVLLVIIDVLVIVAGIT